MKAMALYLEENSGYQRRVSDNDGDSKGGSMTATAWR